MQFSDMVSFRCFPLLLLVACTRVHACTHTHTHTHTRAQLLQSCPTLCKSMDYSLPGSSVHGDSPDKNTGVGSHALLQGSLLTQELNLSILCLLHCQFITTSATWEAQIQSKTSCKNHLSIFS